MIFIILEENPQLVDFVAPSSGSGNEDFERLCNILRAVPSLSYICLDVANGYTQHFVEFVRKTRNTFPTHTIIVSILLLLLLSSLKKIFPQDCER